MKKSKAEPRQYDVFLSYRHLKFDTSVAKRLEYLLEHLKHPILRERLGGRDHISVFRDEDELPIDSDLTRSLEHALSVSRYLVVILTRDYPFFRYCMEEIRYFKEKHGGSLSHVFVLVADGEPKDVIPEELRWEMREVLQPDGTRKRVRLDIEPLWCDIRSSGISGTLTFYGRAGRCDWRPFCSTFGFEL